MVGFIRSFGGSGGGSLDSSDATALPQHVRLGQTFYANNEKKTGTMPEKAATVITPGSENIEIPGDRYLTGVQTILGDPSLVSSNIKKNAIIFNVKGSDSVVDTTVGSGAMTAAKLLRGYKGFVNGEEVSGSMTDKSGSSQSAAANAASSQLRLAVPAAGYYDTSSELCAAYSTIASLLGITASKIVSGNTICGVAGSHKCENAGTSTQVVTYINTITGSSSKSISCNFAPKAVAWLLRTSTSGEVPDVTQARIGGWCSVEDDGYLTSVTITTGNTFTKTVYAGSDIVFYDSSVVLNNVLTDGLGYCILIIGEEEVSSSGSGSGWI